DGLARCDTPTGTAIRPGGPVDRFWVPRSQSTDSPVTRLAMWAGNLSLRPAEPTQAPCPGGHESRNLEPANGWVPATDLTAGGRRAFHPHDHDHPEKLHHHRTHRGPGLAGPAH